MIKLIVLIILAVAHVARGQTNDLLDSIFLEKSVQFPNCRTFAYASDTDF